VSSDAQPRYSEAAVVGGGVIGVSWTALFLARGLGVTVADPLPDIADRVRAGLREIAPTIAKLGLPVHDLTDDTGALKFNADVTAAVTAADVVQENGPERADVKQQLWAAIERGAPAHAIFASSSSSIPASVMSTAMREPGRLVIGHPFNPPHLVPLVEIVPSPTSSDAAVRDAVTFYRAMGKQPQVLGREIPFVELFRHPTIESLAQSLGEGAAGPPPEHKAEQARARTETRREGLRQLQQVRRRRGSER